MIHVSTESKSTFYEDIVAGPSSQTSPPNRIIIKNSILFFTPFVGCTWLHNNECWAEDGCMLMQYADQHCTADRISGSYINFILKIECIGTLHFPRDMKYVYYYFMPIIQVVLTGTRSILFLTLYGVFLFDSLRMPWKAISRVVLQYSSPLVCHHTLLATILL